MHGGHEAVSLAALDDVGGEATQDAVVLDELDRAGCTSEASC